ncbi:unnamed protein product [Dicrocoelium dendriticum]|nr:unnamed protein product [Dicrocoelium dendriticum]
MRVDCVIVAHFYPPPPLPQSQTDRSNLQAAEKQLAEERKQRVALEQQLSARQHSRKARKELVSSSASGPPPPSQCTAGKGTSTKSVTCVSRGISTSSPNGGDAFVSSCTGGGDACAARVKELEAELHLLSLNLSAKDLQLTALKDSRALHIVNGSDGSDRSASHDDRPKSSSTMNRLGAEHSEKEELLSKLRCLQEENRRMTDTLKEEDKMKQELMTAYHSSLREITDLNASLTRKEFQIVELNMRLEGLTPHLCDYLNLQNGPLKYFPNQGTSSGDNYTMGQYHPLRTAQPPDPSSLRHSGSNAKAVGRPLLTNRGLHDGRSARTQPNGLDHSLAVGCFNSKMGYTYPVYGSGFLDGTGVPVTERPPCIGDNYSQLTMPNGSGIPPHTFDSSYSGFLNASDNGHPCAKAQLGQSPFFGRPPATHMSDDFNRFGSPHLDSVYSGGSHPSSISSPFYHQSRQASTVSNPTTAYPDLTTRMLPMGNAALNSSLHPSTVSSPIMLNTNVSRTLLSPQSLRCDFQSFSTGCTTAVGPSESMMTTATDPIHSGLLHSPSGLEFPTLDSTPANCSISYLLETMTSARSGDNTLPVSARQQLPHDIFCGTNTGRVQQQSTFMSSSSDNVNAFLPVTVFSGGSNALNFLRTSTNMDSTVTQSGDYHPSNESALDSESNLSLRSDSCSTTPTLVPSSSDDV